MFVVSNGKCVPIYGEQGIRGMAGPDGNPIGTVIDYMGKSAPDDYLICNGETYQISDWPDLADFFEAQYGKKNEFGGDGTSTFGVPALSGEQGVLKCIKATKEEPYEDVYSEKETVVGRWIDGRPIYRIAAKRLSPLAAGYTKIMDAIPNLDNVISLTGTISLFNNTYWRPAPTTSPAADYYFLAYGNVYEDGNIGLWVYVHNELTNKPITYVMEYTKSTDEPLTQERTDDQCRRTMNVV